MEKIERMLNEMYYYELLESYKESEDEPIRNEGELKDWLKVQKDIWLKLVDEKKVRRDDTNTFFKFGDYVKKYYTQKKNFPNYKEIITSLSL
jgi:hypothetical protein